MFLEGKIFKDKKSDQYVVCLEALELYSQGESLDDGLSMAIDAIRSLSEGLKFTCTWQNKNNGIFTVQTEDTKIICLILKRKRAAKGWTLKDFANHMGYKSANAIAAYENGNRIPSITKFNELMKALDVEIVFAKKSA